MTLVTENWKLSDPDLKIIIQDPDTANNLYMAYIFKNIRYLGILQVGNKADVEEREERLVETFNLFHKGAAIHTEGEEDFPEIMSHCNYLLKYFPTYIFINHFN